MKLTHRVGALFLWWPLALACSREHTTNPVFERNHFAFHEHHVAVLEEHRRAIEQQFLRLSLSLSDEPPGPETAGTRPHAEAVRQWRILLGSIEEARLKNEIYIENCLRTGRFDGPAATLITANGRLPLLIAAKRKEIDALLRNGESNEAVKRLDALRATVLETMADLLRGAREYVAART